MLKRDASFQDKKCLKAWKPSQKTQPDAKEGIEKMHDSYRELMMAAIRCHNKSHDSTEAGHLFTEEEHIDIEQLLLEIIRSQE